MANFNGTILTTQGRNLLAKALTGAQLEFTKVQLGDGVWDSSINPEELTSLVSPKIDLPINELKIVGDGTARIRAVLTNTGLQEGFFTRELGIFAKDPETGKEILYSVSYASNPDYIPADGVTKIEDVIDVYTVIANAQNVTAVIPDTVVIATKQDIQAHNQSPEAHPDIRQAIQDATGNLSQEIDSKIEAHNQSPEAHPELLLKFIWRKETRNPTPDDVPPYDNALWLNLETGEIFVHLKTCNGKAFWKGQFGTIIAPSTVSVFDIFGDGSAVALYRFDGSAADDGGQYNGTWVGTEQYDTGIFGQAAKFDGSSYINLGNLDSIFSQKSYTVSGWIKGIGAFLNIRNLDADASSNDCKGGLLYGTDSTLYFVVKGTENSQQQEIEISNYQSNVWNFVVIRHTLEQKTVELWLNGELKTQVTYTGDLIFNDGITGLLGVHHYSNTYNYFFRGLIDQVRIFNRALTDEEVQILYNEMEVNC